MKKFTLFVALASVMLATSCAEDVESTKAMSNSTISVHPFIGNTTRAAETTTANLQSFKTYSFQSGDDKNYMDGIVFNLNSGQWTSDAGTFYWPKDGDLNFYSYAPEKPGETGEFTVTPTVQKLTGFTPFSTAATQQDFIYSKATGNYKDNGTSGVDINFSHALSEITVAAKNDNSAYTVEVSGVKIGNVTSKGDFTFPTLDGGDAAWTLGSDKSDYTTEWATATTLGSKVSSFDASNTAFMLIPQQLEASDKAVDGNYIALKVKITMQGGQVVHDGWAYVAVPTLWEMGKHYTYTLDYSHGAGQDENGNEIISGTGIKFNVTVTPWDEENVALPRKYISGKNTTSDAFHITINGEKTSVTPSSDKNWKFDVTDINLTSLRAACTSNLCEAINLSNLNTSNVTTMEHMFHGASSLKTIYISGLDTHNVTEMSCMFYDCKSLTSLDLSNLDVQNVTEISGLFRFCNSLNNLNLTNCKFNNLKGMSNAFEGCSSLTTLDLSEWNTSNVTNMSYMFSGCKSLETLDLSGWNMNNVKYMDEMFKVCTNLKTIYMVGCDNATIEKVKSALTEAGLSTDIVKTTKG